MTNAILEEAPLSQGAIALIEKILRERPKPVGAEELPRIGVIISSLMGEASADDAQALGRRFACDPAARALLRRVDKSMESIRRMPWDDVVMLASTTNGATDTLTAEVARVWQARLSRQMALKPLDLSRHLDKAGGLAAARRDDTNRDGAQALVWSTLHAALRQSLRPTSAAHAYAIVRGPDPAVALTEINVVDLPGRYSAAVVEFAEITEQGTLEMKVSFRLAANPQPTSPRRGDRVRLELTAGGQTWLLDEANITGHFAEWRISNMASALGMAPGPLDLTHLTLKFGRALRRIDSGIARPSELAVDTPETLTATVIDQDGRQSRTQPAVTLTMPAAPNFRDGRLCLQIGLPASARFALASYRLNIDLAVTSDRSQRLGSFPVTRWSDDGAARLLEIPWPGGGSSRSSAELALMLLQISLQSGAGSRERYPET